MTEVLSEVVKRELMERHDSTTQVIAYWMVLENICTIFVHDGKQAVEFVVPNEEVKEWFDHPFAHPDSRFSE